MKKKTSKKKGDAQKNDKKNTTALVDSDICFIYYESFVNLTCHTNDWVINSGALFHVTTHHNYFKTDANSDYGHV